MGNDDRVREIRQPFDEEPLVELREIGPDEELDEGEREAIAQLEAGQFISHEAVVRWLKSWGTDNELPPPQCGE